MAVALVKASLEGAATAGGPGGLGGDEARMRKLLRESFQSASHAVAERGKAEPELDNMGTTLVAWVFNEGVVTVAHVGDSRCYLLREGSLHQLTMDHVLGNEHVRAGFPRSQADRMPMRHVLVRNVGVVPPSEPDVLRADASEGDTWLLCSDGLSNKLAHSDIEHLLLARRDPAEAARHLVEEAWHRGGEDNISVVVMEILA